MTAPGMESVIAAALAAHQPAGGHRDLRPHCICGEWVGSELAMFTEVTVHQARAVLAAISEAGVALMPELDAEPDYQAICGSFECRAPECRPKGMP